MERNEELALALLENPATESFQQYADLELSELLERLDLSDPLLKDVPIIKWLVAAYSFTNNVQKYFFFRKYSKFIGPIAREIPKNIWNNKIIEITGSNKRLRQLVDETILSLDRYQTTVKAEILGVLFVKTFKERAFTFEEYNTLLFSIDLMHPYKGLDCLKKFYQFKIDSESTSDQEKLNEIRLKRLNQDFSPLATTCLLRLPIGGAYFGSVGGAFINDLGEKFCKEIVLNINDIA